MYNTSQVFLPGLMLGTGLIN
uniref:Uncharacterized protein n=1 Tax=Anguilla anguilla TaxID=7936 RepID=A0A0E9RW32_ANGAN